MSRLARVLAVADTLSGAAGELTSLDFAEERGWLDDAELGRKAQLQRDFDRLFREAEDIWRRLPVTDPADVERHEARVRQAIELVEAAGGKLDHFYLEPLKSRARETCVPDRRFDYWAIRAVHKLTQLRGKIG